MAHKDKHYVGVLAIITIVIVLGLIFALTEILNNSENIGGDAIKKIVPTENRKNYEITANSKEEAKSIIDSLLSNDNIPRDKIESVKKQIDKIDFDSVAEGKDVISPYYDNAYVGYDQTDASWHCLSCGMRRLGRCGVACVGAGVSQSGVSLAVTLWI